MKYLYLLVFARIPEQTHQGGGVAPGPAEPRAPGPVQTASLPQRPKAESACVPVSIPSSSHAAPRPLPSQDQARQNQAPAPAPFPHGQQRGNIPWYVFNPRITDSCQRGVGHQIGPCYSSIYTYS